MNPQQVKRLNELSDELEIINASIKSTRYNASLNQLEEREKLFDYYAKKEPYNPQFVYADAPSGWEKPLQKFVNKLRPDDDPWEEILYRDVTRSIDYLQSIAAHDPGQISARSIAVHGIPSRELVALAYDELVDEGAFDDTPKPVSSSAAAAELRQALQQAGMDKWTVEVIDEMSAHMSVRSSERLVKIRSDASFDNQQIERLLVHEIGTHVFRYENGCVQPFRLVRLGLIGYMTTEEGMATYHESLHSLQDPRVYQKYALRVIAAHLSLTHSFYEVFVEVAKYTDKLTAFEVVKRSKRGFRDTAEYGAHVKDKVYFEGFHLVSQHLNNHPDDYTLLMSGKVALYMLPLLRELKQANLLQEPAYLPSMFSLD